MTLGNFGAFYSCLHDDVKSAVCDDLHMPKGNFDPPVTLKRMIFTFKDLRNAVAHNGIGLDVRFKTGSVSKTVGELLKFEMGIPNADFEEITDYILLITYLMARLEFTKTECRQLVQGYREIIEKYRKLLPYSIYSQFIGSQARSKLDAGLISPVIRTLRGQVRIPAASRTDAAACARPPSCRNGVQIPCRGVRMGPAGA